MVLRTIPARATATALLSLALCLPLQAATDISKSPNDKREYASFTLPNELKVLLISDPDTDKAAAALDVFVGSASDPEDYAGLAHFLEHMLFLGTDKYPEPDEYHGFISTHGGGHNAYTAPEHTNYFFDIDADYLQPALDRFGQFFIAPRYVEKYVDRERQVVHSEYESKKKNDGWRALSATKQALNPAHPYSRFSIGAVETLADRDGTTVRDALVDFYLSHYSANLMTLVVLGKEPLPMLKQWVTEIFSAVPNHDAKPLQVEAPLYLPEQLPARLDIVPLKEQQRMTLVFPLPSLVEHYRSKPMRYISYLLGHEGKGSLLSLLKNKGWSEGLNAGLGMNYPNGTTFNLGIDLTRAGIDHIDDIAALAFQYLRLIGAQGISKQLFDEQRQLAAIDFRFQEQSDPTRYVSYLAGTMQRYPLADILRAPYAMDHYDPELIRQFLALLNPHNVLLSVVAPGLPTDATTRWFNTPYRIQPLTPQIVQRWNDEPVDIALAIPEPNEFIPQNLALRAPAGTAAVPELLNKRPGFSLWFDQDETFTSPRANFYFTVRSPVANDSPEHAVLTELYVKLINEQLSEFSYPAYVAGLKYRLYKHIRGFAVRISGYSDKQDRLLERVVGALTTPDIAADRFARIKDELLRDLKNVKLEPPYQQAMSEVANLLIKPYWTEAERIAALQPLTPADLAAFIPELLASTEIVALSHGNITRAESLALAATLKEKLLAVATPVAVAKGELVKLNHDNPYIRELDVTHNDSAIAFYVQGEDKS